SGGAARAAGCGDRAGVEPRRRRSAVAEPGDAARLAQRLPHVDRDRLIDDAVVLREALRQLGDAGIGQRRDVGRRRRDHVALLQGAVLAPPRLGLALQLLDRARLTVDGLLELLNQLSLLGETGLERAGPVAVRTQGLDQRFPRLELGLQRRDLGGAAGRFRVRRLLELPDTPLQLARFGLEPLVVAL